MVSEISILIPVYNQNVLPLVEALLLQASSLTVPYEIRVYDDGSSAEVKSVNQRLSSQPNVVYQEVAENIGRSKIRYLLAQEAQYEWLLFLDNDVLPAKEDFLLKYIQNSKAPVAVGGVAYQEKYPREAKLRWLYGKNREQASSFNRQKTPYDRVFFSNLLLKKQVFLTAMAGIAVQGYGHEDSLFAHRLKLEQVDVQHLDNYVYHLGLESADVFLAKTEQAIENLVHLQKTEGLGQESMLFKTYCKLKSTGLVGRLKSQLHWLLPVLRRNLRSENPSLFLFDLYKLLLLIKYVK
ncbi:glycosyltransferase family 2 protein [Rufibacter roseus]|uniref:Glycosyltransferase family 2 protein n=1 Tax=Rufibacter roseus TaxID=1567108 RepID=A0ABW2DN83_9BACT|nr:glycosyltransferase [Rufibacter roseus]